MKVYIVEDTFQLDGGSYIYGIYTDTNTALEHQQRLRRERAHGWGLYREGTDAGRKSYIDQGCRSIGIREVELDKEITE